MPSHKHKNIEVVSPDSRKTGHNRERGKPSKSESSSKPIESSSKDRDAERRANDILKRIAKADDQTKTEAFIGLAADNPDKTFTRYKIGEQTSPSGGVAKRTERAETFRAVEKPVRQHATFDTRVKPSKAQTSLPERRYTVTEANYQIIDADPSLRFSKPEVFPESQRDSQHESFARTERDSRSRWDSDIERSASPEGFTKQDHFTSSRKDSDPDENDRSRSFSKQDKGTKSYPLHGNLFAEVREQPRTIFDPPQQTPVEKTSSPRSPEQHREKQSYPLADIFKRDDGTPRPANFERSRPTPDPVENTAPRTFPKQDKGTGSYPLHDIFTRNDGTPRSSHFERSRPTPDPVEKTTPRPSPEPIKTEAQPQRRDTAPPQTKTESRRNDTELPKPETQPRRSKTESQKYTEAGRPPTSRGFASSDAGQKSDEDAIEKTIYTVKGIRSLSSKEKLQVIQELGPKGIAELDAKVIDALGPGAIRSLDGEKTKQLVQALGPQKVADLHVQLRDDLLDKIGPPGVRSLLNALKPAGIRALGAEWLNTLGPKVIREVDPAVLQQINADVEMQNRQARGQQRQGR